MLKLNISIKIAQKAPVVPHSIKRGRGYILKGIGSGADLAENLTVACLRVFTNQGSPRACSPGKFLKFEPRKCHLRRSEHGILSYNLSLLGSYFRQIMLGNARKTTIENFERIYRDLQMYNTKAKSPYLRTTTRSLNIHLSHASLTSYSMERSGVFMLAAVPLVHIYRYPTQYFRCYIRSIGLKAAPRSSLLLFHPGLGPATAELRRIIQQK